MRQYVVFSMAALVVLLMVPVGSVPALAAGQADPKATGSVGYTAYGLQRYADFDAHQTSPGCTSIDGQYVVSINGGTYIHDMTITGNTAVGDYPSGPGPYTFTWTATVGVVGNAVTISIAYDSPSTYTTVLTGTIAPDGTMSGTGTNGVTDWTTTSGHGSVSGCNGKGSFSYIDTNGAFYTVNVNCVKVDGKNTWFSGPVVSGNVGAGQWLFAEVHDGGTPGRNGDQIWGSFAGSDPCLSVARENAPSDGPFGITSGNLVVHT